MTHRTDLRGYYLESDPDPTWMGQAERAELAWCDGVDSGATVVAHVTARRHVVPARHCDPTTTAPQ